MRSAFGQAEERALVFPAPAPTPPPVVVPTTKEIPYDYVATFALTGRPGNRVQDVINISVEGVFVAVAIAYSFIPAQLGQLANITFTPQVTNGALLPDVVTTLTRITADTIANLLRLVPAADNRDDANIAIRDQLVNLIDPFVDPRIVLQCLLVKLCGIDFRYSITDSGTGRELQNLAIHNIAGLGKADGDRPFRPLAKPMLFLPRSTIRIEIEEISEGPIYSGPQGGRRGAQLFIVLHGYKMLGSYGTTVP